MKNYTHKQVIRAAKEVCPYKYTSMGICSLDFKKDVQGNVQFCKPCDGDCFYISQLKLKLQDDTNN